MFKKIAIVVSNSDLASINIGNNFISIFGKFFEKNDISFKILNYNEKGIFIQSDFEDYDLVFYASIHSSESKRNSLTVHVPGNFSDAHLGGISKEICFAPAQIIKSAYLSIKKNYIILKNKYSEWAEDYEITLEVTHHGPFIKNVPVLFIEIGSDEKAWNDKFAGEVIARSIVDSLLNEEYENYSPICVGLGGTHYASNFVKLLENSNACVGHIVSKHALEYIDCEMLDKLVNKTYPKFDLFAVDYKGLGKEKQRIKELISKYSWKKTDELKK